VGDAEAAGTALDTSVMVPALLSWHEHHHAALPVVQEALAGREALILPLPALIEAFAVLTRLPPPWRLRPEVAHKLLYDTFQGRARVVGLDGDEAWALLDGALKSEISGGATYDAHIAACALKAGAACLVTFNRRHFERFDLGQMTLRVPSAP